ncbi:hypothetical protein POPTR_014G058100v4 [Populus trichocarpa]|uniref:non-specific serine/threonine protein kinase n=1 Tax=Populus trichocarpa TaxID=3694 RepID=U5FP17_POPTR|nr:hypothetical protein POPTR_014G058100v4 [Populus trichocarpa]
MGTPSEMKPAYIATLEEDWKSLAEFYEKHKDRLLTPMSFTEDTAFHMAVYSKDEKLLKCLLDYAQDVPTSQDHKHPISITNVYGHTPLHLAASRGNSEAVKLLVEESKKILQGETPLFRAAAFGQTEIVKYLARQPAHIVNDELLLVHRQRNDGQSILHVAVVGENFDSGGKTCLGLLTEIPSAFKSGHSMSIFSQFLYMWWPMVERIWENKRKLKSALQLAKMLIKSDVSWDQDIAVQGQYGASTGSPFFGPSHPLLTGTKTGILEVVSEMLIEQPHFLDLLDEEGKNILHVAIKYRRKDIFHLIKSNRIISNRMSYGIDKDGYTLLHQVADNKYYSVGSKHGPALQLHEESKWFTRVEKLIPSYYAKLRDSKQKTAEELFNDMHKEQLLAAQQWAKETSQSCSAVAVLVATIVFAAAYTVPGASSLTSVVMFLSILTSSFDYKDFRYSIPRKLTFGFTLLFFSVMATMLAFAATILLIVQSGKQLMTGGLISIAALFPVSVFAMMQFRFYAAFMHSTKGIRKAMRRSLPWFGAPLLFRKRKQWGY